MTHLTIQQAAERMGVSRWTVARLLKGANKIPHIRYGKTSVKISVTDLENYIVRMSK